MGFGLLLPRLLHHEPRLLHHRLCGFVGGVVLRRARLRRLTRCGLRRFPRGSFRGLYRRLLRRLARRLLSLAHHQLRLLHHQLRRVLGGIVGLRRRLSLRALGFVHRALRFFHHALRFRQLPVGGGDLLFRLGVRVLRRFRLLEIVEHSRQRDLQSVARLLGSARLRIEVIKHRVERGVEPLGNALGIPAIPVHVLEHRVERRVEIFRLLLRALVLAVEIFYNCLERRIERNVYTRRVRLARRRRRRRYHRVAGLGRGRNNDRIAGVIRRGRNYNGILCDFRLLFIGLFGRGKLRLDGPAVVRRNDDRIEHDGRLGILDHSVAESVIVLVSTHMPHPKNKSTRLTYFI